MTYCIVIGTYCTPFVPTVPLLNPYCTYFLRRCLQRQQSGFNGRPNKPVDTCYSFWLGASLTLLGAQEFINKEANFAYLMTTQVRLTHISFM